MHRLLKIGFRKVGAWNLEEGSLGFLLDTKAAHPNTLYAFVVNGEISYIGKTTRTLKGRLAGYVRPGATQVTNIRNHENLLSALRNGAVVEIFALPDEDLHYFGGFHLNLAAGLEDGLIRSINPAWNGGGKAVPADEAEDAATLSRDVPTASFTIKIGATYWNECYFNTGVGTTHQLGTDGQPIEIFLGEHDVPALGTINRTANPNHTPRIFGGPSVRSWIQKNFVQGGLMQLDILSPTSIRLSRPKPA